MPRVVLLLLAILLIGAALLFFRECVGFLARRDYVSALILLAIGLTVIAVGKEVARFSLVRKE